MNASAAPHSSAPSTPRIVLTGMGHWFPDTVLDNKFFDELDIGSSAEWIDERVGIKERRSILTRDEIKRLRKGELTRKELVDAGRIMSMGAMCKTPWEMALERACAGGDGPSPAAVRAAGATVDLAIAGTSIPDWDIPANACAIANTVGLNCAGFDVNSACSTFVVNLHVARSLLAAGGHRSCAIFNAERYTTRVDYKDRSSCVLFGDSASAGLLETAPTASGLELIDTVVHSDPSGAEQIRLPVGGFFSQNGQAVQKFAVSKTVSVTYEILDRNGLKQSDLDYFIGHQANYRMLTSACQRNGIDESRHLYNVDVRGNQGATGAPTVLSENWDKYKPGQLVCVAVVGSGLTWGAALFRRTP